MAYKDPAVQRAYQNEWIQRRRREWIETNGPCAQCGSDLQLEVDHLDPKIKVSHRIWSWAKARREAELAKCQVLCHSCHQQKSIDQQTPGVNAGETHPQAVLTADQVRQIRSMTGSSTEIGNLFGVRSGTIRKIKLRILWASVI